jgi:hypothetical protein
VIDREHKFLYVERGEPVYSEERVHYEVCGLSFSDNDDDDGWWKDLATDNEISLEEVKKRFL